jgi:hypothetical protein
MANGCCGPPVCTPSPVGYGNTPDATDAILVDDSANSLLTFEGRSNEVSLTKKSVETVRMEVSEWDQPLEFPLC